MLAKPAVPAVEHVILRPLLCLCPYRSNTAPCHRCLLSAFCHLCLASFLPLMTHWHDNDTSADVDVDHDVDYDVDVECKLLSIEYILTLTLRYVSCGWPW